MIQQAYITAWRDVAPWPDDAQVEQDLALSRAVVEIFQQTTLLEQSLALTVAIPWFTGTSSVQTYHLDELMGTKLRALYQRRKGRDLFDLWLCLSRNLVDPARVVKCFISFRGGGMRTRHTDCPASRQSVARNKLMLGQEFQIEIAIEIGIELHGTWT